MTSPARLPLTGVPVAGTGRRSALLATWVSGWLQGRVAADDVLGPVQGRDEPHVFEALPSGDRLVDLLADLRRRGAAGLRLVLPVPGDPRGIPAPGPLSSLALDAGEAVVVQLAAGPGEAFGLVPEVRPVGTQEDGYAVLVRWRAVPTPSAVPPPPGTLRQAERELADALREAAGALAALDVARLSPEAAEQIARLRAAGRHGRPQMPLPGSHPTAAQNLLAQADRLSVVLDIAGADDGGAIDLGSARERREVLRRFAGAVRLARLAAVNAPLDPPG